MKYLRQQQLNPFCMIHPFQKACAAGHAIFKAGEDPTGELDKYMNGKGDVEHPGHLRRVCEESNLWVSAGESKNTPHTHTKLFEENQ